MGVSTNGIISFGVTCEEDTPLPWINDQYEDEIEEWWRAEQGFVDVHKPWTQRGEYADGWSSDDPRFGEYFASRRQWLADNPIPIEEENYCSGECPMYAIVVPNTGLQCFRGDPREFSPDELVVTEKQVDDLNAFLNKYEIEHDGPPRWLLMSYWG